ncbi:MAG: phosphatase PAP2 family protein [Candidatus Cloacimonetes bacterium]|nr:phosphatase PAP2 family protein [Candidatus Cloacimonadota bacterium]
MKTYKREIIIISVLLLAVTALFYFISLDIDLEKLFYNHHDGWYLANQAPWKQLRDFSSVPALLLAVFAVGGIILGYNMPHYAPYRKIYLYLVVLMILGPGLIVNVVLKDNFGRPRPRSITEFDGKYQYEAPLAYDQSSPGKSFPCGHASMGFYFFGVFILYRSWKRFLAILGLLFGFAWGGLIGFTRMLQGGHFFSDVIWSAALIYLTALVIFRVFKFSPDLKIKPKVIARGNKRIMTAAFSILIVLIILGVLLATPRRKTNKVWVEETEYAQVKQIELDLTFLKGSLEIVPADKLLIQWKFEGFGFPKSDIRHNTKTAIQDTVFSLEYSQYIRGFFTELQQDIILYLPEDKNIELKYSLDGEEFKQSYRK